MIGVLMTALALGCALLALAIALLVWSKQKQNETETDLALKAVRAEFQALRNSYEAQLISMAEKGMSQADKEDTTIK